MRKIIIRLLNFITFDLFRISETEVSKSRFTMLNILKTVVLAIRRFSEDRLMNMASALTYSTFLSIVPMFAVVFAVARGFGFENIVLKQLGNYIHQQNEVFDLLVGFVDSYLSNTKNGIFVGVGLVLLFWTVINLIINIEYSFNRIWEIKKSRKLTKKLIDYFSMFIIFPLLIIVSSGFSLYLATVFKDIQEYIILSSLVKFMIKIAPYVITWIMFTCLYLYMPNTKVQFKYALISGIIAGTAYQIFQMIYINSQIFISNYNAIYGSFAALPMLLIWLQMSWTICLVGVEITYLGQNVQNFDFEEDTRNISRRYSDFVCILFMSLIVKNFITGNDRPYTARQLSSETKTPARLTQKVLNKLVHMELIHQCDYRDNGKNEEIGYMPSKDVSTLSVGSVIRALDKDGSEKFKIDIEGKYEKQWKSLIDVQRQYYKSCDEILLKDIEL